MFTIPQNRFRFLDRAKKASPKKGVVIFIAVFVIAIVGGIAAIYSYTTRHSKMSSRRMFYGETVYFVAESALEEAFLKLQDRPDLIDAIFASKIHIPLELSLSAMNLGSLSDSGVEAKDIKIMAKAVVLKSGETIPDGFMDPNEKIGIIELVATIKMYGGGFRSGKPTIRQVTGRRNFRYVKLTGPSSHTNYGLFIKHRTVPTESRADTSNNLTIAPGKVGRIYLGTDERKTWESTTQVLRPSFLSTAEKEFMKAEGFRDDGSGVYVAMIKEGDQLIEGSDKKLIDSDLFVDSLIWDPKLERTYVLTGNYASMGDVEKNQYRSALRGAIRKYLRESDSNYIKVSLESNYERNSEALNLGIEAEAGEFVGIEGNVLRQLKFSASNEYPGNILPRKTQSSGYAFAWKSNQRNMISLLNNGGLPLYETVEGDGVARSGLELEQDKLNFTPYRKSNQYSYVYTKSASRSAWQNFKQEQMIEYVDGSATIKVDGVMVVVGEIDFNQDITYQGKGVILALNGIRISANIRRMSLNDQLIIVTRGVKSDFIFESDIVVDAYLMGHKLGAGSQTVTLNAGASSNVFEINGGLSLDELSVNDLPEGSRIKFDSSFASDYFHLSMAYPIHYYKIDNQERQKLEVKKAEK
ncbi:MAG: hypothetical protein KC646_16290 [Candidatus Cloacimonetes bacterium]|nr:hypothetical protein [Candidatus Cloacimonadota bacterium]